MKKHIVIINSWPRYPALERWDNSLVCFEKFIDHQRYHVSYLVDQAGRDGVLAAPDSIFRIVHVNDLRNYTELHQAFCEIHRAQPVDIIVALSEFHLLAAARLREAFSIPGPTVVQVERYRDKVKMKRALELDGIRVPRFHCCTTLAAGEAFAREVGYPLILKPRDGAASQGVIRIEGLEQLRRAYEAGGLEEREIEEFIEGDLFHVDGFSDFRRGTFTVISQYYNTPLDFNHGRPVGSYLIFDEAKTAKLRQMCLNVLRTLQIDGMPFHMEAFLTPAGDPVFLEIGARVGGAEVPIVLFDYLGINLFELWMKALVGESFEYEVRASTGRHLGFLLIPRPMQAAFEVQRATCMKPLFPNILRELVPAAGTVISDAQTYNSLLSGRFMFEGASEANMRQTIEDILAAFRIECQEIATNSDDRTQPAFSS